MKRKDETRLIEQAQGGDRHATSQLLSRCYPSLLSTARMLLRDADEAQDVAQEAAVAVFEKVGQLRNAAAFGSWSKMIVRRICLDYLARSKRFGGLDDVYQAGWTETGRATAATCVEDVVYLSEVLGKMGDRTTEILNCRLVRGLSVRETAFELGLSEGAVKLRLHRARRKAMSLA